MSTIARPASAIALVAFLALLIVGCSSSGAASQAASLPARPSASLDLPPTVPPSTAPVMGEVPEATLQAIRRQLAIDAPGMDLTSATVVRAEAVQWSDGSLGCPQRGVLYTQMITPGYHVVISVNGVEYDYRATQTGEIRRCEAPGPLGS